MVLWNQPGIAYLLPLRLSGPATESHQAISKENNPFTKSDFHWQTIFKVLFH
jgi:hypothetical protein